MSAWGTALYSDDTTCDVRDDYVNNLKRGLSDLAAAEEILGRFGSLLADPEIACLVYFALSDTAWKYGRLDQRIRQQALMLIRHGGDLFVWERDSPSDVPARRRALEKLEKRLLSEQPPRREVKVVKPAAKKARTNAEIGTVFLLPLLDNLHAALILIGYQELEKSIEPNFLALNWFGSAVPSAAELDAVCDDVVMFGSGRGPQAQVAVLPMDGRKNPIADMRMTSVKAGKTFSFEPFATVYLSQGRIIRELCDHFKLSGRGA